MSKYQVGGSLNASDSTYVTRKADKQLYRALLDGEFCYMFNCRQMGKSSLRVRVKTKLEQQGYACVSIDMTNIGSNSLKIKQWYKSIASELWRGFNLIRQVHFKAWWEEHQGLSPLQQLNCFIDDVVLTFIETDKIFIFIDEIDSVISLNFSTDDFFALIRYFYNQRAVNDDYKRLSFALFGVVTPSDLIDDRTRTPFNVGTAIELTGFTLEEAQPLIENLQHKFSQPEIILQRILTWTGGQPFLTQKLCSLVLESYPQNSSLPGTEISWLENIIKNKIIDNWEAQDEPEHLRTISDRILSGGTTRANYLLGLIAQVARQGFITADDSAEQRYLLLSNLVVRKNSQLVYRNPIYQKIFNLDWIERQQVRLHPFSKELELWLASEGRDKSRLLRGKALEEAQAWAKNHTVNREEYKFLTASQQQETQQALEAIRLKEVQTRLAIEKYNSKLQEFLIATLSIALVLTAGLGLFARRQYIKAKESEAKMFASQHQSLINAIETIAASSEALFLSEQRFEALILAVKAKAELNKLTSGDRQIVSYTSIDAVDRNLQRVVYGVQERNRLMGHSAPIWDVTFSPDDKYLLSGSQDNTAKLWQLDGTLVRTYRGHQAAVRSVDFSPDRTKIITSSWDKTIKIWDVEGKLLKTLKGHQEHILDVQYSPDSQLIASASFDRTLKLWTADGELITTIAEHQAAVTSLDFNRDGTILASSSEDKTIKLWDVKQTIAQQKPVLLATIQESDLVNDLDFAPNNRTIVSALNNNNLTVWDITSPKQPVQKQIIKGHRGPVISVAYNRNTGEIISTSGDTTIKIWSPNGVLLNTLEGHRDPIFALGVTHDGKTIASGAFDNLIRLWQPQKELLHHIEGHTDMIWQVAYSPDGRTIASASFDSTVKLWDRTGELLQTLHGHQDRVEDVIFNPKSQLIASGSDDGTIKIWNLQGKLLKTINHYQGRIFTVVFSPDGNYLASGGIDGLVKIWNLQGKLIKTFKEHQGSIIELGFSPDGKILASASMDKTVKLWNWLDSLTPTITLEGHQNAVHSVVSSPDGQTWATGSWDGTIKLWNSTGRQLATFRGHQSEVHQIKFSPDGKIIASTGADSTVRLWNLQGKELLTLESHAGKVWSVDFSPDGNTLITGGEDSQIIVWDLKRILNLDHFEYACQWIKDYLKTNPDVATSDRQLCSEPSDFHF